MCGAGQSVGGAESGRGSGCSPGAAAQRISPLRVSAGIFAAGPELGSPVRQEAVGAEAQDGLHGERRG